MSRLNSSKRLILKVMMGQFAFSASNLLIVQYLKKSSHVINSGQGNHREKLIGVTSHSVFALLIGLATLENNHEPRKVSSHIWLLFHERR